MHRRTVLLLAVVCLSLVGAALLAGTAIASSATLEIEAAADDSTDSSTVSFTFTTQDNATQATIQDTFESRSGGSVVFEFEQWEEANGFDSGTSSTFDVDGETTYRVTYTVEADSGADDRQYFFEPNVGISYEDKPGETVTGSLSVAVDVLEPAFGTITEQTVDGTFEPDDGSELERTLRIDIPNTGDGFMDVEDMSISGEPFHISASVDSLPGEIDGESSEVARIDITVDDSISEGTHSFSATVTDSLGNSESIPITVDVAKPPAAGTTDTTVDLGEILVGESESTDVTLTERNEFERIDGLDTVIGFEDNSGSISFPGLDTRSISAGGSTTQTVEVTVDDDAQQGEQLEWQVSFTPQDPDGLSTDESVTFTAEVIYPPYYEEVSMPGSEFVFDEPRQETDDFTDEVDVAVTNGGDLPMELLDVAATVPNSQDITVAVVDTPSTIGPKSEETVTLDVLASSETPEGEWSLDVELTADEPTSAPGEPTGTVTTTETVTVEHETELHVDRTTIDAGEVIITEQSVETVTISERLGYQAIEDLSIVQESGPDSGWLTVTEQPESLDAGEQHEFSTTIEFDTAAELYQSYDWTFTVSGANVETETITVQAVPEPVDFGETIAELEGIGAETDGDAQSVAVGMADTLDELERMLQAGDEGANRDDITVLITAGSSSILLLDATGEAQSLIEDGDHDAAQEHLVRASSAFNTLSLATEDVSNPELQSQVEEIHDSSETLLADLIEQQEAHFLEQLEDPETTMLEEAQTQRELARLAELSGDEERANELRTEAEAAFESYSQLISDANEELIAAQELEDELDDDLFMSPAGVRLFWIGSLSTYNSESERILDHYDTAIEQFEEAGATERAETAAAERAAIEDSYGTAYLLSIGLGVVFAVLLLVVIAWEIRALYRYRLDSEAVVSGDFLLPWAETE